MRNEFEGPFPVARANYFAVMELVLKFWKQVAQEAYKPGGAPKELVDCIARVPPGTPTGIDLEWQHVHIARLVLIWLTKYVDARMGMRLGDKRPTLRKYRGVTLFHDAIEKVCVDAKVENFLWKDI
jgi:hypothetical protein